MCPRIHPNSQRSDTTDLEGQRSSSDELSSLDRPMCIGSRFSPHDMIKSDEPRFLLWFFFASSERSKQACPSVCFHSSRGNLVPYVFLGHSIEIELMHVNESLNATPVSQLLIDKLQQHVPQLPIAIPSNAVGNSCLMAPHPAAKPFTSTI